MARLIGNVTSNNFGENLFIQKIQESLDDTHIIYWNRQVYGRSFDVCILCPGKGMLVVELKGWREETILRVEDGDTIVIQTEEGECQASPMRQAIGYRFALEQLIKRKTGQLPLVFQMVCLPQVSEAYYKTKQLDLVLEESFTFVQEDLADQQSFLKKLNLALAQVTEWHRVPFDDRMMLEVRSLFEPAANLQQPEHQAKKNPVEIPYESHDYSRLYFISTEQQLQEHLTQMMVQYLAGCKLYCIFTAPQQMEQFVRTLDQALTYRGVVRQRDQLAISFDDSKKHSPIYNNAIEPFQCFHCSCSLFAGPERELPDREMFCITDGKISPEQEKKLRKLAQYSQFNLEQYLVEHTELDKNIMITAGAGTGKTYTMVSRIGFLGYHQELRLEDLADRIVMITFTNEAADQMREKLKQYFRNCYLLTSRPDYLAMLSKVDHMQISTIDSYAKKLLTQMGADYGYGVDLRITSSEYYRQKKIAALLDEEIERRVDLYGTAYREQLSMPTYQIRGKILELIGKLHNKSVDIAALTAENFGTVDADSTYRELHNLFVELLPKIESVYQQELKTDNRIHLSTLMSTLHGFLQDAASRDRLRASGGNKAGLRYLFVDEFQDTDDMQIEALLTIAELMEYQLFVVGDIKQCIYRFRGAQEAAFQQLHMEQAPERWATFSLQRNYRSDVQLLKQFHPVFAAWGSPEVNMLTYGAKDQLLGCRQYNDYCDRIDQFYKQRVFAGEERRIPVLIDEIGRLQRRLKYDEDKGKTLSPKEKSIAILVRENWQADLIRKECAKAGITVWTETGGDLYMSQPALDMMALVNGLLHFDEAEYLYHLTCSNFFRLEIPKCTLYDLRKQMREGSWRAKTDEKKQVNTLLDCLDKAVSKTSKQGWMGVVRSLREEPVLQVLRNLYTVLKPWEKYSEDALEQQSYCLNVDLLFEQLIRACNIDRLTINTLQEQLYHFMIAQTPVESRTADGNQREVPIRCITVHKSKGLEYGHVILPFCDWNVEYIKPSKLNVCTSTVDGKLRIDYSMGAGENQVNFCTQNYDVGAERQEKAREEARILYVAMTRAIRSFTWLSKTGGRGTSWQMLIEMGGQDNAV